MRALRTWIWPIVVAVLLVAVALAERDGDGDGGAEPPSDGGGVTVVVGDIGDGDSFRLDDGERVRMIGIDTPEVDEGECFAIEARDALRELMPRGTEIRLTFDEERTDRFGRTLAYVHRAADGLVLNLELVRLGYAEPLVVEPNSARADEIAALADEARSEGVGRWGACPAD